MFFDTHHLLDSWPHVNFLPATVFVLLTYDLARLLPSCLIVIANIALRGHSSGQPLSSDMGESANQPGSYHEDVENATLW